MSASSEAPMVEVNGVAKSFSGFQAVKDASFSLKKGKFLTILGPSGSGKTTVLRMIAGFLAADKGSIRIHGLAVDNVPVHQRSIGMVFQKLALFPHMTAEDNIAFPLNMRRFDATTIPRKIEKALAMVQLAGFGKRRPHELSGGQQQRVAIARALVFEPDLLLLDEPLAALDKKLREEMQIEFRRIQKELGVTTINVTHDQREALVMSDEIIVMNEGAIEQIGTPDAIYRKPATAFVAQFIGLTNMLKGKAADASSVRIGETILKSSNSSLSRPEAPATCAIRAEDILLEPAEGQGHQVATGTVTDCVFEGDRLIYEIRVPALGSTTVRIFANASHRRHAPGEAVKIGWLAQDVHLYPA